MKNSKKVRQKVSKNGKISIIPYNGFFKFSVIFYHPPASVWESADLAREYYRISQRVLSNQPASAFEADSERFRISRTVTRTEARTVSGLDVGHAISSMVDVRLRPRLELLHGTFLLAIAATNWTHHSTGTRLRDLWGAQSLAGNRQRGHPPRPRERHQQRHHAWDTRSGD